MAQSRLERIGTIYSRISSLMKGGAMKFEDKPLWYNIYEAFPPKLEPRFDRVAPNIPVREIFYKEDVVRAKFQSEHNRFTINLHSQGTQSQTQKFLDIYDQLEKSGLAESEAYDKAMEKWAEENTEAKIARSNEKSVTESRDPVKKPSTDITDIFKQ
ncbi:28S ribosomal protein S23, mitochondrial [Fopius arisanus]|uniref:Small ribosomal subunit protein mS23 n=1 Tax=Fopius arisanus TaxID=64838 RepID=A0A0C9RUB6_9HYME|nr:PREDICTED: 28S ribosomal protein S23, mitochondrial [Fopius arisanus]